MPKWIIHLENGETLSDKDCYPHEVPQDKITSVERVEGNLVASILKSEVLSFFFVKTSASQDLVFSSVGGKVVQVPAKVEERIVGAFILPQDSPVRLELIIEPETKKVKVRVVKVKTLRKDGL